MEGIRASSLYPKGNNRGEGGGRVGTWPPPGSLKAIMGRYSPFHKAQAGEPLSRRLQFWPRKNVPVRRAPWPVGHRGWCEQGSGGQASSVAQGPQLQTDDFGLGP